MKKVMFLLFLISGLTLPGIRATAQINDRVANKDTLCILWTSGDSEVALKMVFMYANAAKQNRWFDEVELIVWGPSSKLTSENIAIQESISKMLTKGIKVEACKACTDQYGISDKLKLLGIEVKYMGVPLTKILKSNKKLITF